MPINSTNDLKYQPPVQPTFYSPPKPSIIQRLLNSLSFTSIGLTPFKFLIKVLKKLLIYFKNITVSFFVLLARLLKTFLRTFFMLIPEILLLSLFFAVFLFILNYFNILSLSYIYPQYFGTLPHNIDFNLNASILSKGNYSKDNNDWQMEVKLYATNKENVYVEYKNRIALLRKDGNTYCYNFVINKISETQNQAIKAAYTCSNILKDANKGKYFSISYKKTVGENFIIESIGLE